VAPVENPQALVGREVQCKVVEADMAEYRVYHPTEVVLPGEEVWVKVLAVDRKRRRVDLSIAQAIAG